MSEACELVREAILDGFVEAESPVPLVSSYPGPTDPPTRGTVVIGSSAIDPPSVACPARLYTVRVFVASPIVSPGFGDVDVDVLVDHVLDGLDASGLVWSDVTRGVWQDQYPAYVLTVEVSS